MRRLLPWVVPTVYVSRDHCHGFWLGLVVNYWSHQHAPQRDAARRMWAAHKGRAPWFKVMCWFGPFEVYTRGPVVRY